MLKVGPVNILQEGPYWVNDIMEDTYLRDFNQIVYKHILKPLDLKSFSSYSMSCLWDCNIFRTTQIL